MSILSSMNIAQQALVVNQAALSVVSNNIANVDTEGYSRERVVLSPGVNYTPIGGSATNQVYSTSGVDLVSVERYTDNYLTSYFRQQTTTNSYLSQSSDIAASVQETVNELKGTGLEKSFSLFYEAAQTLSLYPTDSAARLNYVQQAQTVALNLNSTASDLTELRTSLVGDGTQSTLDSSKISGLATQVNQILEELADINKNIVMVGSSDLAPNSLLDTRDQKLLELAELIPVSTTENTNGTINVSLGDINLIKGTEALGSLRVTTGTSDNPATVQLFNPDGSLAIANINDYIDSGSMGAVLDMAGPSSTDGSLTILGVLDDLDELASGFADIINTLQTTADADGTPMAMDKTTKLLITVDPANTIFESNDGGAITASSIKVNSDILNDPYLVAVARVDITDYEDTAVGNNANMTKVLNSRSSNSSLLNDSTPESYVATMVSSVGLQVSAIDSNLSNQTAILSSVETRLASATGVNINEELMDLTKYQTAYQASARIYTVCNELLDTLINLGR